MNILSMPNKKTAKNETFTVGVALTPVRFCPNATPECISVCFGRHGTYSWKSSQEKQKRNSDLLANNPTLFMGMLSIELEEVLAKHKDVACRLNLISDFDFASLPVTDRHGVTHDNIFRMFPTVKFYGYTKVYRKWANSLFIDNLHLTFSFSGRNWQDCDNVLKNGGQVAVPFNMDKLPSEFMQYPVIDGEVSDERWNDPKGVIVGLSIKANQQNKDNGMFIKEDFNSMNNFFKINKLND